jgi:carbon monoxide dehydrogenase subunit G
MTTTTVSKSIDIDAPVEKVFAFIANPETWLQAMPYDRDWGVRDVATAPDGSVMSFKATLRMAMGRLHYDFENTMIRKEFVPNERLVQESHGLGTQLLDTYIFEQAGKGTRLTNQTEVSTVVPLWDRAGILLSTQGEGLDQMTEEFLAKVKDLVEA